MDKPVFSYNQVDGADDIWHWGIIKNYEGPQEYDECVVAFAHDETDPIVIQKLLALFNNERTDDIEMLLIQIADHIVNSDEAQPDFISATDDTVWDKFLEDEAPDEDDLKDPRKTAEAYAWYVYKQTIKVMVDWVGEAVVNVLPTVSYDDWNKIVKEQYGSR